MQNFEQMKRRQYQSNTQVHIVSKLNMFTFLSHTLFRNVSNSVCIAIEKWFNSILLLSTVFNVETYVPYSRN